MGNGISIEKMFHLANLTAVCHYNSPTWLLMLCPADQVYNGQSGQSTVIRMKEHY
jgi:hypothetical protein